MKYFLEDGSRVDGLACNCNSCLFPTAKYYREKFPELYDPDRFPKVNPESIPAIAGRIKGGLKSKEYLTHAAVKSNTVSTETKKAGLDFSIVSMAD